jgi:hypothetical protein
VSVLVVSMAAAVASRGLWVLWLWLWLWLRLRLRLRAQAGREQARLRYLAVALVANLPAASRLYSTVSAATVEESESAAVAGVPVIGLPGHRSRVVVIESIFRLGAS